MNLGPPLIHTHYAANVDNGRVAITVSQDPENLLLLVAKREGGHHQMALGLDNHTVMSSGTVSCTNGPLTLQPQLALLCIWNLALLEMSKLPSPSVVLRLV
jgi:hypothetical protein